MPAIRDLQRGDTIIEVLFAVTVFSLVAIGGMSIMNQGLAMAQRSLEIGLVRQQMDEQIDALKFLNQAYVADYGKRGPATTQWNEVVQDNAVPAGQNAQNFDAMVDGNQCRLPTSAKFALDISKLNANPVIAPTADAATYAQVRRTIDPVRAEGLWIQAVRSPQQGDRPGFYDFHVRACWTTPGQTAPVTLGTIVRLYEPRG